MRFLSNFGCKIMFMCSVNFCHQQDSNSLFNGSIGHVTLSAIGLLLTCKDTHIHTYIHIYILYCSPLGALPPYIHEQKK